MANKSLAERITRWDSRPVKIKQSFIRLGFELQMISESATMLHYIRIHPDAKVGLRHVREGESSRVFIVLDSHDVMDHVFYGDNGRAIIQFAHQSLVEGGYLTPQSNVEEKWGLQ
jgi:hypothetical protein